MGDNSLQRNFELSLHAYLVSILPSSVRVVDENDEEELTTCTVGFERVSKHKYPFELGNLPQNSYLWLITVYANTRMERDVLASTVFEQLVNPVPVYDYANASALLGYLLTDNLTEEPVRVPKDLTDKLRFRSLVSFKTIYQEDLNV